MNSRRERRLEDRIKTPVFVSSDSSEGSKQLFAYLLDFTEEAKSKGVPLTFGPGVFFQLQGISPTLGELHALLEGRQTPWASTSGLVRLRQGLRNDALGVALREALRNSNTFEVNSGREIASVLGAISQTLFPIARISLQQQNRALASRFLSAARAKLTVPQLPMSIPAPDITQQSSGSTSVSLEPWMQKALSGDLRRDEAGQQVATDSLIAWHSSSVGFTDKSENQDATFACTEGNRIIFALADGITTSLGSREGAAVSAESVCTSLQARLKGSTLPNPDMFRSAFEDAHRRIRSLAQALLALPLDGDLRRIGQDLQESSIRRLLELGLDKRPSSPVLASTLIAGVLTPKGKAMRVDVMRVGDGVVEKIDRLHRASSLITMDDRSESGLNAYLGPDQHSLESAQEFRTDELMVGEWLLVSSDGLVRAHEQSIWDLLAHLLNTSPERFLKPDDPSGARKLLDAVAVVRKAGTFPRGFIEDNWSVVLARILKSED